ncbi:zinc-dependent dehydrogenase [soil metagenome]
MLAAVFRGPGELEVAEVETPEIGAGEVLVKVGANTVCGTDVRILRGEKTGGIDLNVVLGHEMAGHVAEVGREVEGYEVGAPVAMAPVIPCRWCFFCRRDMENMCSNARVVGYVVDGGLGEYMRVPALALETGNLFVAHEDLPSEQLALAEPLSCVVNGHKNIRVAVDDTVLILGSGPIGLLHLQVSLLSGARTVIVSDPSASRRAVAEDLGASVTVDPTNEDLAEVVAEHTDGLGVDAAIICIGIPALVNDAFKMTRKGGRVNVFAGLAGAGWSEVEANLIHYNELFVTGASNSRRADYEKALRLIESGRVRVEPMVTHRFPLEEAVEAIDKSASGDGIKVAVMP